MREAASRLNVTRPAVTQGLKALEEHIGVALFDRSTKPASLTAAGEALARATRNGLGMIDEAMEDIRIAAGLTGRHLTVSCTIGMATYWLMPRLPDFYAHVPDVLVNVQAPPSDLPALTPGVDLALRYGNGGWRDGTTTKLFDERISPVGRPDLVEKLIRSQVEIGAAPLIHVRSAAAPHWEGWSEYFGRKKLGRPRGAAQVFDNYIQAVQAALDGRGLMLGWRSITEKLVRDGALTPWPEGDCDPGMAYFVTVSPDSASKPAVAAFRQWIENAAEDLL
jgi:DNA-binding transcriptional LysR family regulator